MYVSTQRSIQKGLHAVDAKATCETTLQVSHVMVSKSTHKLTHTDIQTHRHRGTDTETQRHRDTETETQTPFKGLLGPSDHTNDHKVLKPFERYPSSILGAPPRPRLAVVSVCTFVPSKLGGIYLGRIYLRPAKNRRRLAVLACATKRHLAHC